MEKLIIALLMLVSAFSSANTALTMELRYYYLSSIGTDSMALRVELVNNYQSYAVPPFSWQMPLIGVYEKTQNKRILLDTLRIESITEVLPNFSPLTSSSYSLYRVVFSDTIFVPNTTTGYTLYVRESPFYGKRGSLSSAFCAIPPNTAQHSMHEHSLDGYHAMAMGETFVINAQSTDKDGDSLTYEFAPIFYNNLNSYDRFPDTFDSSSLFWPMGDIAAAALKLGGIISINTKGIITNKSTNPVGVVFGLSVTEWRNGVAIANYYKQILLYSVLPKNPDNAYIDLWGSVDKNGTVLSWVHSLNGKEVFYIERRIEGGTWEELGTVALQQYWMDKQPFPDTVLRTYRIRATGEKSSKSVKVLSNQWGVGGKKMALQTEEDFETDGINIYPNPAINTMFVETDGFINTITITDLTGKTVLCQQYQSLQGIDVSGLPTGNYILTIAGQKPYKPLRFDKQ